MTKNKDDEVVEKIKVMKATRLSLYDFVELSSSKEIVSTFWSDGYVIMFNCETDSSYYNENLVFRDVDLLFYTKMPEFHKYMQVKEGSEDVKLINHRKEVASDEYSIRCIKVEPYERDDILNKVMESIENMENVYKEHEK